jgi:murein tripeptide amidase MpaA
MPVHPRYDADRFYQYDELVQFLRAVARAHPRLVRLHAIGRSHQGRELIVVEITQRESGKAEEKPAYWIDANIHASELSGSAAALYTIDYLTRRYGSDPEITHLIDTRVFYILPRLSPDGAEHCLTTGEHVRSSVRPFPFDEIPEGLRAADVNGDGEILQMRVKDPLGGWAISDKDPRLMRKRKPGERRGTFYRLYREGVFERYDGFHQPVPPSRFGLDFNRQWPYRWEPPHRQYGAGLAPLSEPETRAVAEFILSHPNIAGITTYHTFSGVVIRPYSDRPDKEMPIEDRLAYDAIASRGNRLSGYPLISCFHHFTYEEAKPIVGVFDDWCYDHRGIITYTIELWSPAKAAGVEVKDYIAFLKERPEEEMLKFLRWNDKELGGRGFKAWTPFEHPQLGAVEIGGWRWLRFWTNPPATMLPEVCRANMYFTLVHAASTPCLRIAEFAADQIAPDLRKVTLVIENTGFLPTNVTKIALDHQLVRPVIVELDLPARGVALLIGKPKTEIGQLAGTGILDEWESSRWTDGQTRSNRARVEWLVRGAGPLGVVVKSERAGVVRAKIGAAGPPQRAKRG